MGANILVVDDSGTMRGLIKRTLSISGLDVGEVFEAANGIEALAQMATHAISVVLLDINMPVMNGLEFLQRVQKESAYQSIPVIIISTEGKEEDTVRGLKMGAKGYVKKPFQASELHGLIEKITAG